jgi:transcriptional regulator with XRE-family HTH domain
MNIGNLIHAERKAEGKTLTEIADVLTIRPKASFHLGVEQRWTHHSLTIGILLPEAVVKRS